jgi:hypothetical protein
VWPQRLRRGDFSPRRGKFPSGLRSQGRGYRTLAGRLGTKTAPRSGISPAALRALKMATDVRNRRKREEQTRIIRRRVCARFVLDASPWRSVARLVQVVALSESLVAITPSYDPSTCVLVQTMRQAADRQLADHHPSPRAIQPLDTSQGSARRISARPRAVHARARRCSSDSSRCSRAIVSAIIEATLTTWK